MMKKITIATTAAMSVLVLSACQSTTQVPQPKHERMMKHHQDRHMAQKQQRGDRGMQRAIAQACEGEKVGEQVDVTIGQRHVTGQCEMVFMPERGQKLKSNYKMQTRSTQTPRNAVMTDAERAEMVKEFDLRLAQRQAQQKAIQSACQGQTTGKAVQIKFGEHSINGQCQVKFKLQTKAA
jgi:hypothetical protein